MKTCNRTTRRNAAGFTLIEVMIAVAVVGIVASIAVPSYRQFVLRSNRAEGKTLLLEAATRQERFFADNGTYTITDVRPVGCAPPACGLNLATATSENGKYTLVVAAPTLACPISTCFSMSITPVAGMGQTEDTACLSYTVDSLGQKTATKSGGADNTAICWD
ncbi:MAG: type IV pilin protein [Gammaproteobacteria bacterium]